MTVEKADVFFLQFMIVYKIRFRLYYIPGFKALMQMLE